MKFPRLWSPRAKRDDNVPDYWRAYKTAMSQKAASETPIQEVGFVVLDTETTGLDHREDAVVSFAALRVRGNAIPIGEAVDWRLRASLPSAPDSIEIHGLLNRDLDNGLNDAMFVEQLTRYVGNAVLVGYRPGFDLAILNRMVQERVGERLTNPTLDVFDLAMRLDHPLKPRFVNPEPYRLDRLCDRFGVDRSARHTAAGDAYATSVVLLCILQRLGEQGVETLGELLRRYH